uniref:Uncharacterized protein n=1 Tax=viral metagenome TaxID=1070528 RepID=A0A6H1Z9A8_9ZZZZ
MTMDKKKAPKPRSISAKQVGGVETPATVMLTPVHLDEGWKWWSHDGILVGGVQFDGDQGKMSGKVGYVPILVPRTWTGEQFHFVAEYEADAPETRFKFRLYYGCGDPAEIHRGESAVLEEKAGGKRRMAFELDPAHIDFNELFRVTIEVIRETPGPIKIYGAWLEVGV